MKTRTLFTVFGILALSACHPAGQKPLEDQEAIRVEGQPARTVAYRIPARSTGLLGTSKEMKLSFKTGGIVSQVHVREGSSVSRGKVLAELDLSEIRAQVNQAKIGLEKAGRDLERARNLYRDSVATLEQYQNARSAFDLARSKMQIADFNLEHSRITAPTNGKIQKILVETNEVIGPGHPAILFASTENDWVVRTPLTDKDIVRFSIGDSASVSMDAFPGEAFTAEVTELGTVADPVTGTYEAELLIASDRPQFRTGFIARVEIFPAGTVQSLVVPIESLLDANDHLARVFLFREGKAVARSVRTGRILGSSVVVQEGLEQGDTVITEGARYLRDGMEVVLVSPSQNNRP